MEDKNVSFEKYFLKYKNLIIRVIVDGSGDYQLAQEICQLVYERFYKNMDKVRPGMEKVWLIRCAKNALTDHYRKARSKAGNLYGRYSAGRSWKSSGRKEHRPSGRADRSERSGREDFK